MTGIRGKTILKWTILILPWVLALLLAAGWGLSTWTPGYLEKLVPEIAEEMNIPLEEFHVRDAGLFSADLGPIRLGDEKDGLALSNVHVTYTPASLKQRRVDEVTVQGVRLRCEYDGESLTIPVMDLFPQSEASTSEKILPELPFGSLTIKDSVLNCTFEGNAFSIPFNAKITPGETISFSIKTSPRDQKLFFMGDIGPTLNDLSIRMISSVQLEALGDLLPITMKGIAHVGIKATVDLTQPDSLEAEIDATIGNPALPGTNVEFEDKSSITINGKAHGRTLILSMSPTALTAPYPMTLSLPNVQLTQDAFVADYSINTAGVTLPGNLKANRSNDVWDVSLTSSTPDTLNVETGDRRIRLGGVDLNLSGTISPDRVDVVAQGSTKYSAINEIGLKTGGVRFTLPLAWPAPKNHSKGSLRISRVRHEKRELGTIAMSVRQESMGLAFGGTLFTEILPGLRVPFSGKASMISNDATLKFGIDRYVLPGTFAPATLLPDAKGIEVTGALAMEGGVNVTDGEIDSQMGVFFTGGTVTLVESGTTVSGIRLFFESPDLLNFRSAPAQILGFESLRAGGIEIDKGLITFQLEPSGVVLVENLGFDWAGGHVASRAFRVVPGLDEYDVTLFCSQLRLSDILAQLGLAEAKGAAALSGELPVTWKNGQISFNNGFLHSSPGQGGTIQVEAMEDLVDAIPKGTPQRGQLELAQAAIKDFDYKWVRIKADTVGEDLRIRLSLDGKPAGTLPFVYKREFGGFAKVTGDVKGSNFQGLRLDVNFNVPLDRILLYKDLIDMIE